ncbi:MAG: aminomethyl-transferring glycine dehydrogenase subunit GcvPA [Thermoplasmataceae archaeon]
MIYSWLKIMNNSERHVLGVLNMKSTEELFSDIPAEIRVKLTKIDNGITEMELISEATRISSKNSLGNINFLGNGVYDRFVPSSVNYVIGRSEFLTSYTPYQPEISQGMLQGLFEYQSLISELVDMDITNSSMYDGSTALGEAVRMSYRINGKSKVLLPENILKNHLHVLQNYGSGIEFKFEFYKMNAQTGEIDINDLESRVDAETCCVVIYNPNCYGIVESRIEELSDLKKSAILVYYYDPVSLGVLMPPGQLDADIAIAEGQSIGINPNFGGPTLGLFSFKSEFARKSPGRIIGKTVDCNGKPAYVMTLQTREQHIRRDKATSNICTNQALMSIASSVYLSIVGSSGLRKIAMKNFHNAKNLQTLLSKNNAINSRVFSGTYFSDLIVGIKTENNVEKFLLSRNILGGKKAKEILRSVPKKENDLYFFAVTEKRTDEELSLLNDALEAI